jgi:hypothetical protein
MWKVKRMNTARIVGPTIAIGVGDTAAFPAGRPDFTLLPIESINVDGCRLAGRATR